MNISKIKNLLFTFFLTNEKLILPDDLEKVISKDEVSDLSRAAQIEIVKIALNSFVDGKILAKFEFVNKKTAKSPTEPKTGYILEKSLESWEQSILLPGSTCSYIAQTLNSFKDKDEKDLVNPLSLNYLNIEELMILIGQLLKKSAGTQAQVNNLDLKNSGLN